MTRMMRSRLQISVLLFISLLGIGSVAAKQKPPAAEPPPSDGVERIDPQAVKAMLDAHKPVLILDVRVYPDSDTTTTRVKGSKHISVSELEARLNEIPSDRLIVTYCS